MTPLEVLLDALDGAQTDWATSTDAMRWSPPRPRRAGDRETPTERKMSA